MKTGVQSISKSLLSSFAKSKESFWKYLLRVEEWNVNMLHGCYIHNVILEPENVDRNFYMGNDFVKDENNRSGISYLDYCKYKYMGQYIKMPEGEVEQTYSTEYTTNGHTYLIKGRIDIVTEKYIVDLKTASDLSRVKYAIGKYDYDLQGYMYNLITGTQKPFKMIFLEKSTGLTSEITLSELQLKRGRIKFDSMIKDLDKYISSVSIGCEFWLPKKIKKLL